MSNATNQKNTQNPWHLDVRTRERNLKSGALTDKELEKHLAQLPDMEGSFDSFVTPQPALAQPVVVAPVALADESDDDLGDEEDDDESSDDVAADAGGDADADAEDKPVEGGES